MSLFDKLIFSSAKKTLVMAAAFGMSSKGLAIIFNTHSNPLEKKPILTSPRALWSVSQYENDVDWMCVYVSELNLPKSDDDLPDSHRLFNALLTGEALTLVPVPAPWIHSTIASFVFDRAFGSCWKDFFNEFYTFDALKSLNYYFTNYSLALDVNSMAFLNKNFFNKLKIHMENQLTEKAKWRSLPFFPEGRPMENTICPRTYDAIDLKEGFIVPQ